MIDFLLEGGRKRGYDFVEVPAVESGSRGLARGLETVDGAMMTIIIKHVKRWMMIDINA
jgi:hypothetical protein